jgi:hypothetical protein
MAAADLASQAAVEKMEENGELELQQNNHTKRRQVDLCLGSLGCSSGSFSRKMRKNAGGKREAGGGLSLNA